MTEALARTGRWRGSWPCTWRRALRCPPFDRTLLWWLAGSYLVRMFGITAGYHRYFSHRSFKLGRAAQLMLAILAQTSAQKGVLWWAAHHRDHHRHADTDGDVHSPRRGFWWAHVGWSSRTSTAAESGFQTSGASLSCAGSTVTTGCRPSLLGWRC
jgi:stearoyl-CoA desaturase (delta-9 desaturase)